MNLFVTGQGRHEFRYAERFEKQWEGLVGGSPELFLLPRIKTAPNALQLAHFPPPSPHSLMP